MTIEACTSACISNNYTLAGVEYGGKPGSPLQSLYNKADPRQVNAIVARA
jgi:hypothetical protein